MPGKARNYTARIIPVKVPDARLRVIQQ
jgi:hypothetical protein